MIVYKTTNTITGKIYVGQDINDNQNYLGSGIKIRKAIKKYGRQHFTKEVLCECQSIDELNAMELHWIRVLNSTNPDIGYNIHDGGRGWKHSPTLLSDTKQKMSESHKGKSTWNCGVTGYSTKKFGMKYGPNSDEHNLNISMSLRGKIRTPEHSLNISKSKIGCTPWNKGIPMSEDTKEKLRAKNSGKKLSLESRKKMSEAQKLRWKLRKGGDGDGNSGENSTG